MVSPLGFVEIPAFFQAFSPATRSRVDPDTTIMHTRSEPDRRLLDASDVAELLQTSRTAIYTMVEREQLAGVRDIGCRVLFDHAELLHWLNHTCAERPQLSGDEGRRPFRLVVACRRVHGASSDTAAAGYNPSEGRCA